MNPKHIAVSGAASLRPPPGEARCPDSALDGTPARTMERASRLLLAAARLAFTNAEMPAGPLRSETSGCVVGSARSTITDLRRYHQVLLEEGPDALNPADWPRISPSAPSSRLALAYGLHGPAYTLTTGETSSLEALAVSLRLLREGRATLMLAGGVEENPLPEDLAFAESAAALILEPQETALESGRKPLLLLSGAGSAFPLQGESPAEALTRAARCALAEQRISFHDLLASLLLAPALPSLSENILQSLWKTPELPFLPTPFPSGGAGGLFAAVCAAEFLRKTPPGNAVLLLAADSSGCSSAILCTAPGL